MKKKTDFGFAWAGEEIDLRWWWDGGMKIVNLLNFNSNLILILI